MSTEHTPQAIGHHLFTNGVDHLNRRIEGNAAIVVGIEIIDPADLPLGGPSEPGLWGQVVRVEDPGGRVIRDTYEDEYSVEPALTLDPPEATETYTRPGVARLVVEAGTPASTLIAA